MSLTASLQQAGRGFRIALDAPVSLARAVSFSGDGLTFFGAPPASANPLIVDGFDGSVARGASCNCSTLTLTPHCHGTHTECVGHLTCEPLDAWRIAPRGLMDALLVSVTPRDRVVSREALHTAMRRATASRDETATPTALILRTLPDDSTPSAAVSDAAHVSVEAAMLLVECGIQHVVLDLASMDPAADGGALAAHRVFFGLPPRHQDGSGTRAVEASKDRAHCTITEFARIPPALADGPCLLQLAMPELDGDAVPSAPLLFPLVPA